MNRLNRPVTKILFAFSVAALLGAAGCQEREREGYGSERLEEPGINQPGLSGERPMTPVGDEPLLGTDTEDPMLQNEQAIQQLVDARCELAQRCGDIGSEGDWSSLEVCRTENQQEYADDLKADDCPGGINATELNECLQEIRQQSCDAPFEGLSRIVACRSSDMCNAIE